MRRAIIALAVVALAAGCSSGTKTVRPQSVSLKFASPKIEGTLRLPKSDKRAPVVVLLSGSGANDADETVGPNKPFRDLANGLAARGIATFRYAKRTKQAPLSVDAKTFTASDEYVPDALAAIHMLAKRDDIDAKRIFVAGHSLGGMFAPKVAAAEPKVAGVIVMAAPTESFGKLLLRQVTYIASLNDPTASPGAQQQLPSIRALAAQMDDPHVSPTAIIGGGSGAYFLDLQATHQVAIARALPQPILLLQGGRDYQVTVADNFDAWVTGLAGRSGVTSHVYPNANHLFIDGSGTPGPAEYNLGGHVDKQVITDIAAWLKSI